MRELDGLREKINDSDKIRVLVRYSKHDSIEQG